MRRMARGVAQRVRPRWQGVGGPLCGMETVGLPTEVCKTLREGAWRACAELHGAETATKKDRLAQSKLVQQTALGLQTAGLQRGAVWMLALPVAQGSTAGRRSSLPPSLGRQGRLCSTRSAMSYGGSYNQRVSVQAYRATPQPGGGGGSGGPSWSPYGGGGGGNWSGGELHAAPPAAGSEAYGFLYAGGCWAGRRHWRLWGAALLPDRRPSCSCALPSAAGKACRLPVAIHWACRRAAQLPGRCGCGDRGRRGRGGACCALPGRALPRVAARVPGAAQLGAAAAAGRGDRCAVRRQCGQLGTAADATLLACS